MQGESRMANMRHNHALDLQKVLEEAPQALMGRIKVVVRIAVQRLQEGHRAKQLAARLQDTRDLGRASEGVADMFQDRYGNHRIEAIVKERQGFSPDSIDSDPVV